MPIADNTYSPIIGRLHNSLTIQSTDRQQIELGIYWPREVLELIRMRSSVWGLVLWYEAYNLIIDTVGFLCP